MLTPLSLKDSREWYSNQPEFRGISPQGVYARLGEDRFLAFGRKTPIVYRVLDETNNTWRNILESAGITRLDQILQDPADIPISNRPLTPLLLDILRKPRRITESAGDKLVIELSTRGQYSCIGVGGISDASIEKKLKENPLPGEGMLKSSQELAFLALNSQRRQAGSALRDFHQNPSEEARINIQAHLGEARGYFGLIFQGNQGMITAQFRSYSKRIRFDPDLFYDCITSKLRDAIDRFDASRGFAFSTYFYNVVWREFTKEFNLMNRISQGSLDKPINETGGVGLLHIIDSGQKRPSEVVMSEELKDLLPEILDPNAGVLTEVESFVLNARFFEDKTLQMTGEEMGLRKERVRRIEKQALKKAREYLEEVKI